MACGNARRDALIGNTLRGHRSMRGVPGRQNPLESIFLLLLLRLWVCGQGAKRLVHHIHRRVASVGLGRRPPAQRRVRPDGVVEGDPLADDAPGGEAVGDLVQVDRLVFERAPQPLDEDVV